VRSASLAAASLAVAAAVTVLPAWDKRVMSTGPAIYAQDYLAQPKTAGASALPLPDQLLFYRDGPSATVSVTQLGDQISLRVNGKTDASTNPVDMPTQLNLAHLPLLLHPDPRAVLVIGLGSGITAGAAARHPLERLDVVEIEPAVVEASRFFTRYNADVFKDPRLRLTIADGRNYLLTTKQRYDVIISEPSNPWIGGIASLFSVEYFELARSRLQPGGIMVQWLQAYSFSPPDFQMVVKTFGSVFPATSLWHSTRGDYLLLGRMKPAPIDLALLKARYEANPAVRRDLALAEVSDWPGVLGFFMLGETDAGRYAAGAEVNTDDRLPLEFSAPRALYLDTVFSNWSLMKRFKVAEFPDITPESRRALESAPVRHTIGMVYLSRGVLSEADTQFQRALALDPTYTPAQLGSAKVLVRTGQYSEALARAQQVLAREPRNVEALLVAGLASTGQATEAQAKTFFDRALALQPQSEIQRAVKKLAPSGIPPGR
jgi:spermidine synthase